MLGVSEASWANIVFTAHRGGRSHCPHCRRCPRSRFRPHFHRRPPPGVLGGAALIFFAYLGFEEIANLAEEAREPARDLPRAILIAVGISTALYVFVAVASVALLEPERLAASTSPLAEAMQAGAPRLAGARGGRCVVRHREHSPHRHDGGKQTPLCHGTWWRRPAGVRTNACAA